VEKAGRKGEAEEDIPLVWLHVLRTCWQSREHDLGQKDLYQ